MNRIKKNYTVNLYEVTGLDEDGDIVRSKILVDLGEDDPFIDKVYNVEDYVRQTLIASFSKKFPFGKNELLPVGSKYENGC